MSATRERLERAEARRTRGEPRRGNSVPPGLRPRRASRTRLLLALLAAVAGVIGSVALLRARSLSPDPGLALELVEPARVGAGGAAAQPAASAGPAQVESLAVERDPSGTRVRVELDAPAAHRLVVSASGRELTLIVQGARLSQPLARVDLAGTEIDWLDLQAEPPDLRVVLGLREERLVTSASYETQQGSTLVLDLLPRREQHPAAPVEDPEELLPEPQAAPVKRPATPADADAHYADALAAERVGRLDVALAALESALARDPAHAAARLRLAQLQIAGGAREQALQVLREGRVLDPARADLALLEARLLAEQDPARALAALDAVPAAGRSAEFHALQAALLAGQGAHARAIEAFGAALRAEPRRGSAWLGLAISLEAEGRASEARAAYRRALAQGGIEPAARAWAEERQARLEAAP
jgi:tetratricopeptide (TPR) repeat protein